MGPDKTLITRDRETTVNNKTSHLRVYAWFNITFLGSVVMCHNFLDKGKQLIM